MSVDSKRQITETDKVHEDWYAQAKTQTVDTLPDFVRRLTEDYGHDYCTIVHAIAAAAVGAAWAVENSPTGGITGFQASCVTWQFMGEWGNIQFPAWLTRGEDLLYPQYEDKVRSISRETWEWLKGEAKAKLANTGVAVESVIAHWRSIVAGKVPFGLKVRD